MSSRKKLLLSMPSRRQQQSRAQMTYNVLLESAKSFLGSSSPDALRIETICRECDTNTASAYYHFGSKEGLITKAYVELFREHREPDVAGLEYLTQVASTVDEVIDVLLLRITNPLTSESRKISRNIISRVFAAALTDPDLALELAEMQKNFLNRVATAIEMFLQKAETTNTLSPHQLAIVLMTMAVGRSMNDTFADAESDESWADISNAVMRTLLTR